RLQQQQPNTPGPYPNRSNNSCQRTVRCVFAAAAHWQYFTGTMVVGGLIRIDSNSLEWMLLARSMKRERRERVCEAVRREMRTRGRSKSTQQPLVALDLELVYYYFPLLFTLPCDHVKLTST